MSHIKYVSLLYALSRALMCCVAISFSSFQLHDNALELHKYTRYQKKKATRGRGDDFDGELDNFQDPVLSSLGKLVRVHHTNDLACC